MVLRKRENVKSPDNVDKQVHEHIIEKLVDKVVESNLLSVKETLKKIKKDI